MNEANSCEVEGDISSFKTGPVPNNPPTEPSTFYPSITLGIAAGFLNLIPYLGSFLAMIPAVFLGIVGGPVLLIQVLIVFVIEQTIEGRLISPLVLGNELSIHPVTILLVLLTSGKLFGLVGVILGIPVYAAAKVIITHVFEWYTRVSSLYEDEEPIPEAPSEETPEV